ncbi:MAG: glycosyltransferase family 2 protein [Alphaproteobacteria bacterium]
MRIAVVTPYFSEAPNVLWQCHASVLEQRRPVRHILVSDGRPQPVVDSWDADHVRLPHPHGDAGNAARGIGALMAVAEGYDAVAFLDADNWYQPDHLEATAAGMEREGAALCSSARSLHAEDGRLLAPLDGESDGIRHADTNTLLVHRRAADLLALWCEMPPAFAWVGDRFLLAAARARGHAVAHVARATVCYRTRWAFHYRALGLPPPPGAKEDDALAAGMHAWRAMPADARKRLLRGATPTSPRR